MGTNFNPIGSAEAAEILGESRSTVNRRAAAGELPFIAKGSGPRGPYFFDRATIESRATKQAI